MLSWASKQDFTLMNPYEDFENPLTVMAEQIAIAAKAITLCPDCETEFVSNGDDEANSRAFAIATNRLKARKIVADRKQLMDAIQEVVTGTPEHCPECDRREHRGE